MASLCGFYCLHPYLEHKQLAQKKPRKSEAVQLPDGYFNLSSNQYLAAAPWLVGINNCFFNL